MRSSSWRGALLLLAFAGVVGGSLWVQRESARECERQRQRAETIGHAARESPVAQRYLTKMYALVWPAERTPQEGEAIFFDAQEKLETSLDAVAGAAAATGLQEEVRRFSAAAAAMTSDVASLLHTRSNVSLLRPEEAAKLPALGRAVEQRFAEASAEFDRLDLQLQESARRAAAAHGQAQLRADQLELVVLVLLLAVVGVSTGVLWRLARRVRAEIQQKNLLLGDVRESEAKYRSIFDNAVDGIFQTTPDGRVITANQSLARMYGYKSPDDLIKSLSDISSQLYVDPAQRSALLEALEDEDIVSDLELEVVRADGRTIWLRENVRAVRDEEGELLYLEGTVKDVSSQWWAEQRRLVQYAATVIVGEAASMAEARPKVLQEICEILEWDLGAVWDVDEEARVLRCGEIWHSPGVEFAEFEKANTQTTYAKGKGLAGQVWASGDPIWMPDLQEQQSFPNAKIAVKAGMRSAFGVPVNVSGKVRHVLEFFSPKISLPNPELVQTLSAIGTQLGHLIERKSADELLRRSEMRKAAIVQSALDCIISFDGAGLISEFNPAAERTFGYRRIDVLGRPLVDLIFPESTRHQQLSLLGLSANAAAAEPKVGTRTEVMAMRSNGTEFPAEIAISRIAIDQKPVYTAFLRDISERKAAERITSELAAVVENSNDAILGCTLEGIIRSWNAGAERIFGYSVGEAVGKPLQIVFPSERLDEFPQMLTAVRRGESVADYETNRVRKDGKKISVSITNSPILGTGGVITGVSCIARDITDRKQLEEELLQSQKMDAIGRLAGGIAHDFNNVLTAILGYSDLLISQIDERHWMFKHLSEIRKAGDFAAALTQQLLAFSRRQPQHLRVFNVNESVRTMQKMLQRVIGEHIQVKTELAAELGTLKADQGQLEQVLLNLCVNARDALPNGGTIAITTEDVSYVPDEAPSLKEMPAGEYVKVAVSDTGTGIAPDVLKHIFEPFFTTKEQGKGTGLGLATCYGIVKQTGGYIDVESTVGLGTRFSIYFPRVEATGEKAPLRKTVGELPGGSETILYVEDEITVRSLTAHVLRRLGYTVLEAGSGKQARHLAESQNGRRIDLLFSDVVLPDLDGKELSEWVRRRDMAAKVLVTSGYVDENVLKHHGFEKSMAFLQKPFTPAELAVKVRAVIDGSE